MLFHGVNNSVDGGDKHLIHLSQVVVCCLKERSKQNKCVDSSKEDGVDNSVDDSDDDGDKREASETRMLMVTIKAMMLTPVLAERSKQNNYVDDKKEDGVDDSDENSADFCDKHLTHLTKAVDCCLKERSKQNNCVGDNKDNSVEDKADGGGKHLTHLTKA
eukprot:5810048-Ditylum_brightwellii.AAC.1